MLAGEIEILLSKLNGSGSDEEFAAVESLQATGMLPALLLSKYHRSRAWQQRASCVYHAVKYSRESQDAFELGVNALKDKSKVVRYRATMLLAVSQRRDATPHLRKLEALGNVSAPDAKAAIQAIEASDPNLFVDRDGSGMVTLHVHGVDR